MTETSEARMLAEHGTKAYRLTPSCIVSVAERDLASRRHNVVFAAYNKAGGEEGEPMLRYAFLGKHVRRAKSAAHLIALALAHGAAMASTQLNTIRLYGDRAALQGALDLCTPHEVAAGSFARSDTYPVQHPAAGSP